MVLKALRVFSKKLRVARENQDVTRNLYVIRTVRPSGFWFAFAPVAAVFGDHHALDDGMNRIRNLLLAKRQAREQFKGAEEQINNAIENPN